MKIQTAQQNVSIEQASTAEEHIVVVNKFQSKKKCVIITAISAVAVVCVVVAIVLGVVLTRPAKSTLKKAIVIARHGARTSFYAIPTDIVPAWQCDLPEQIAYDAQRIILNTSTPAPCPPGELVRNGFRQHQALARRLKRDYVDSGFVSARFDPAEVGLRSTNTSRTRASLLGQLAVLFPGTAQFRVDTAESLADGYHPPYPCPWQAAFQEANYVTHASLFPLKAELDQVNAALKTPNFDWNRIWDALRAITGRGDPLPAIVTNSTYQKIEAANDMYWKQWFCSADQTNATKVVKMNVGPVFADIIHKLTADSRKLHLVTAHDTTLAPLMTVLTNGSWDCGQPGFAADVQIELHQQDLVRVRYLGAPVTTLHCAAQTFCRLDEFTSLLSAYQTTGQDRVNLCNMQYV
ncbi:Acid phosphatase [Spironucleus salmonicida]|uniref:Acid phosphatase n=1 Tax=Spironucleus salmonicida TaxID=348837 RepID=V6LF58_9EUKA|nr:Acid phosphatase [Spironucleus salmonicida]|eukprot:EST42913.1 Lysophosphatidic acid phosphatase [Spironucleus salmonicida]